MSGFDAPSRARQLIKMGDVLVSTVRPNLNGVAPVTEEFDGATASTGFCVLRPRPDKLANSYLMHWVRSPQFIDSMTRLATGASYPAVTDRIVKSSVIPLPPVDEQRRIAAILDKADALRRKRQRALDLLGSLSQSIFLEMFGDPISNPKSWPRLKLGDVIYKASDGPHVSPTYSQTGIPFLSTRHVQRGMILWEDLKFIDREQAEIHWKKCRPERGDILYTKGGTTGLAAAVETDEPFAVWVHVALLKLDRGKVEPLWLESMLNSEYCYRQSQRYTHGIANRDLGLKRMTKIEIYLPSMGEQKRFVNATAHLEKIRRSMSQATLKSGYLFSSLQSRAFSARL